MFSSKQKTFAVEFDRGRERIPLFIRTKIVRYAIGLEGFPLTAVLIVTDRQARMDSLARAMSPGRLRTLFSTIQLLREQGMWAAVFYEPGGREPEVLV